MKDIIRTYRKTIAGLVVGAAAGYAYFALVGCSSGSCAITSNPWNSTLYGAVMGLLTVGWPEKKETTNSTIL
jgi:elongation factor P hydroxylase